MTLVTVIFWYLYIFGLSPTPTKTFFNKPDFTNIFKNAQLMTISVEYLLTSAKNRQRRNYLKHFLSVLLRKGWTTKRSAHL